MILVISSLKLKGRDVWGIKRDRKRRRGLDGVIIKGQFAATQPDVDSVVREALKEKQAFGIQSLV